MLLWLLLLPIGLHLFGPVMGLVPMALLLGDTAVEYFKLAALKHAWNPIIAVESTLIRFANDCGRCCGNISRRRLSFIGERFDYFCDGKHVRHERIWGLLKTLGYVATVVPLLRML